MLFVFFICDKYASQDGRIRVIHNGQATGIENTMNLTGEGSRMYDLTGREVNDKQYKGIVVSNKKKVFVK